MRRVWSSFHLEEEVGEVLGRGDDVLEVVQRCSKASAPLLPRRGRRRRPLPHKSAPQTLPRCRQEVPEAPTQAEEDWLSPQVHILQALHPLLYTLRPPDPLPGRLDEDLAHGVRDVLARSFWRGDRWGW